MSNPHTNKYEKRIAELERKKSEAIHMAQAAVSCSRDWQRRCEEWEIEYNKVNDGWHDDCLVKNCDRIIADLQQANEMYRKKILEIQECCEYKIKMLIQQQHRKYVELLERYDTEEDV